MCTCTAAKAILNDIKPTAQTHFLSIGKLVVLILILGDVTFPTFQFLLNAACESRQAAVRWTYWLPCTTSVWIVTSAFPAHKRGPNVLCNQVVNVLFCMHVHCFVELMSRMSGWILWKLRSEGTAEGSLITVKSSSAEVANANISDTSKQ